MLDRLVERILVDAAAAEPLPVARRQFHRQIVQRGQDIAVGMATQANHPHAQLLPEIPLVGHHASRCEFPDRSLILARIGMLCVVRKMDAAAT